jgi:hypothetical protein
MHYAKKPTLIASPVLVQGAMAEDSIKFRGIAEFGFLSVLSHKIQFGKSGTRRYVQSIPFRCTLQFACLQRVQSAP